MLTLSEAKKADRLEEFVAEQEASGIGPIDHGAFDNLLSRVITGPPPKDRTSRSSSGGNSIGKRTRLDTGPDASS